jgi:hypothetical protein
MLLVLLLVEDRKVVLLLVYLPIYLLMLHRHYEHEQLAKPLGQTM